MRVRGPPAALHLALDTVGEPSSPPLRVTLPVEPNVPMRPSPAPGIDTLGLASASIAIPPPGMDTEVVPSLSTETPPPGTERLVTPESAPGEGAELVGQAVCGDDGGEVGTAVTASPAGVTVTGVAPPQAPSVRARAMAARAAVVPVAAGEVERRAASK